MNDWPQQIAVTTQSRTQWVELTEDVQRMVTTAGIQRGIVTVFVPHTTAGITINENADPDVASDMQRFLAELIPERHGWRHAEGNSDAHIKASFMGSSVRVIISEGRLQLGTWQGIFFCEFDGPRRRQAWVAIESAATQEQE
jgi:secondary thiamine-phosphate synthase enzyme